MFKKYQITSLCFQLLLTEAVWFDSPVVVQVYARSRGTQHNVQNTTTPSLEEGEVSCCRESEATAEWSHLCDFHWAANSPNVFQFAPWSWRRMWGTAMVRDTLKYGKNTCRCRKTPVKPQRGLEVWLVSDLSLPQLPDSELRRTPGQTWSSSAWKTLMPDKRISCIRWFGTKYPERFLNGSVSAELSIRCHQQFNINSDSICMNLCLPFSNLCSPKAREK